MIFRKKNKPVEAETTSIDTPARKITFTVKREVKVLIEAGRAHLDDERFAEARDEFRKAVDEDPGCSLCHFNLGYALHELGEHEQARESYYKAIELEPTCSLFLEHLARLQYQTMEYPEALRHFQRASRVGPIQSVSLGLWGQTLLKQGLYEQAVETFENLLEREDREDIRNGARYWLAVSHTRLGRLAAARRHAMAISKSESPEPRLLLELGETFIEARCLSLAYILFEKVLQSNEETLIARLRMEDIKKIENQIEDALPNLFEEDEERLLHSIHSLREFGNNRISKALLAILDSPSAPVREAVIRYQSSFGYDVAKKILPCLDDEVDYVREAAYEYFEKMDSPRYADRVAQGLDDPLPSIRRLSARLLGRFATAERLPKLQMVLDDPECEPIRDDLREAIAAIKRRLHQTQETLYRMRVVPQTRPDHFPSPREFRFWLFLFFHILFIGYFVYFLFFRLT